MSRKLVLARLSLTLLALSLVLGSVYALSIRAG